MTEQEAIKQLKIQKQFKEVLDLAIKALEKQVPKDPIDKIMYKECPVCGSVDLGRYCMECGQRLLDWSVEHGKI